MKILSLNQFNERLNIDKINIKDVKLNKHELRIFTIENLLKIDGFTIDTYINRAIGVNAKRLNYNTRCLHAATGNNITHELEFSFENNKLTCIEYYQEDPLFDDGEGIDEIIDIDDKDTDDTIIKKLGELEVPDEILNLFINSVKA